MGYIIDFILIAVCAIFIVLSLKRGLIKSAMGLVKGVASILISYAFTPMLSDVIYDKFVSGFITESLKNDIIKNTADGSGLNISGLISDVPEWFSQILNKYGISASDLSGTFGNVSKGTEADATALAKYISDPLSGTVSTVAAFVILFFASLILLTVLTFVLDKMFRLPGLNGVNKVGGLIFGIVEAIVFVSLAGLLLSKLTVSLGAVNSELFGQQAIDNSLLLKYLSTHNITEFVTKVIG